MDMRTSVDIMVSMRFPLPSLLGIFAAFFVLSSGVFAQETLPEEGMEAFIPM
jgi:hypothetical protein